ncbi:Eco57I restriction-modification methylase domain-containing protein [Roseiflexus sp. RS-1]|uniref:Eco57I restriction-modification methylase domain-containing protein n=1 Tax=Roseiflexus sp. (strain RS-1) TaxID=357808 RepID=UPI0001533F34|nr:hypothetical protein RoseRS_1882 [Roseiflexus sp. RS-1]
MAIPSSIYPSLRLEGGLFSPDLIEALTTADLPGQKPPDFRLPPGRSLTGEIAAAFNDARALWQVFQNRLERLPADDPATSATREFWVIPFLRLLGYDLRFNSRALEVDGAPFPISHALGADQSQDHAGAEAPVPVHIVGCRQELGRVAPAARPRLSPHALVQEYLNRSEALWGIVTNGRTLRLLRNSTFVRRQAYVEFDLAAIFADEGRFADFVLLYRLLHRTRLPSDGRAPADCLLETYYQQAVEQGGRVRERLRDGVEQAIVILANGFLRHPASVALRATLQTWRGEGATASSSPSEAVHAEHVQRQGEGADALYHQLLRLVYRLLFLLTAEERGLMGGDPLYRDHYGVGRLRRLCTRRTAYTDHDDLWLSLRALWLVLTDERMARLLDAPPLNGELFAHQELDDASIANRDLLRAFWHLAFYREGDAPPRRVNYAALDTEELGSVYESLLDYHPAITFDTRGRPTFVLTFGSERKATGSYYTPPSLVNELVQSALAPVLEERLRPCRTAREKEAALLALNVLDPACGSGHFLLAAARRLGKELARIRTGEDEPAPERVREAIRDVVAHCIYGVDRNPLAVELARVALWLESHAEGKPLTFLDHRIKCGDSLVGVLDLEALREGLPDDAFAPVVGDDRKLAANLKRRNRTEREGQLTLFDAPIDHDLSPLAETVRRIETIRDDTPDQVHRKRATYEAWRTDPHLRRLSNACDLWTAAFFQALAPHPRPTAPDAPASPAQNPERIITTDAIRRVLAGQPIAANLLGEAQALAAEHRFFHWPLEFPEVFAFHPQPHQGGTASGGFDVVLGNPPWERIKLQEEEFFAVRDPQIARAANAAARKRLIAALPQTNPALWEAYQRALHAAESASRFLRGSGQYPLTGRGDINTYSVFAERVRSLLNVRGRAGIIVPTGIATDATNQFFFADLADKGQLASLFDFENRQRLFPAVDSRMKFCLLTLAGSWQPTPAGVREAAPMVFAFFATHADHLRDPRRVFTLTADDIARINPNTRTLPVFRTRQDADLTRAVYRRVPVLVNEHTGENPWGVRFLRMFDMSNDSHLFRTRAELEQQGYRLVGNRLIKDGSIYLPMYEGRLGFQFNHRYATQPSGNLQVVSLSQLQEACFLVEPQFFVDQNDFKTRMGRLRLSCVTGLLGYRRISNNTNERTVVASIIPWGPASYGWILSLGPDAAGLSLLCATYNSLVFDYLLRQSLSQPSIPQSTFEQVAALPPTAYTPADLAFIVPRVLELTYTAWDLKPFADDVWNEADDELRAAIHAAWEANRIAAGGHEWRLPSWISAYPEIEANPQKGIPFPPFRWDEDRRAVLRAELDAYYARLYGLTRKQLRYILDPADLTERELADILDPWEEVRDPLDPAGYAARVAASTFPGETFRVLKEKELRQFGEYRTRRLVLEAWEQLERR